MSYEYFDEEEEPSRLLPFLAWVVGFGAVAVVAWAFVLPALSDDSDPGRNSLIDVSTPSITAADADAAGGDAQASEANVEVDAAKSGAGETEAATANESSTKTEDSTPATTPASTPPPTAPATTPATTLATTPLTTDAAESGSPSPGQVETASYPTLPDGSPSPVLAIFDVEQITLTGAVPSQAAADRLEVLALANSKFPDAAILSFLVINPDVPDNVGVRVIELNSVRFPEGSAEILGEHAAELDRVAAIMNALPNVTMLVVGHSDQRGSEESNFAISVAHAQSVVSYMAGQGIEPDRMSARAVGESDLLTLNDDAAALALNRRTEFVFSGLLVG